MKKQNGKDCFFTSLARISLDLPQLEEHSPSNGSDGQCVELDLPCLDSSYTFPAMESECAVARPLLKVNYMKPSASYSAVALEKPKTD